MLLPSWSTPTIGFAIHAGLATALLLVNLPRRRRVDQPLCRRCGQDLRAVVPDDQGGAGDAGGAGAACPGCHQDLSRPRAVGFAKRRIAWVRLTCILLLAAAAPLWMLIPPKSARAVVARVAPAAPPPLNLQPWDAVYKQLKSTRVSSADAAAILSRATQELSAGPSLWGKPYTISCILLLLEQGQIKPDAAGKYIQQAFQGTFSLKAPPVTEQDRRIPLTLVCSMDNYLNEQVLQWNVQRITTESGDEVVMDVVTRKGARTMARRDEPLFLKHDLPAGEQQLQCTIGLSVPYGAGVGASAGAGKALAWTTSLPLSIRLTSEAAPAIELVDSPALLERVRQGIRIKACYVEPGIRQDVLRLRWAPIPSDTPAFCYKVVVRLGTQELESQYLSHPAASVGPFRSYRDMILYRPLPADIRTAEVRLIPDSALFQQLYTQGRMPKAPIILKTDLQRFDLEMPAPAPSPAPSPAPGREGSATGREGAQ